MYATILIPTIDPDDKLVKLVAELRAKGFERFVVVDDGSADSCAARFDELERSGVCVLHHAVNLGKGAAIKTGLSAVASKFPQTSHVVTVDADGQHLPDDIERVCKAAQGHHDHVVIGTRDFSGKDVPARSRMGNAFSSMYFKFDTGVACPDTQTGLRAIPVSLIPFALSIPGTRYEYEMNFLTAVAKKEIPLVMVPIATVYENNNAASHFSPVHDSVRIYRQLFRFAGSSLACSLVDLALFALMTAAVGAKGALVVLAATIVARLCSGMLNFALNRSWSFSESGSRQGDMRKQAVRYLALFVGQMLASAGLVALLSGLPIPLVGVKMLVDGSLFAVSYFVQRNWVFKARPKAQAFVVTGGSNRAESGAGACYALSAGHAKKKA